MGELDIYEVYLYNKSNYIEGSAWPRVSNTRNVIKHANNYEPNQGLLKKNQQVVIWTEMIEDKLFDLLENNNSFSLLHHEEVARLMEPINL